MTDKHPIFGRYSLPHGEFTVPRVVAERDKWQEVDKDAVDDNGRPLPPKLHTSKGAEPKPRGKPVATTPIDPEAVSGDTPKEN